jgi:hypothetical protein
MTYQVTVMPALIWEGPQRICERRSGYARRNYYAEVDDGAGRHPATAEAERRALSGAGRERFRRMLALSERLARELPGPARNVWLELEAALHAYWFEIAREHYNLGVEAGLERALVPEELRALPPRQRLLALCEALRQVADEV